MTLGSTINALTAITEVTNSANYNVNRDAFAKNPQNTARVRARAAIAPHAVSVQQYDTRNNATPRWGSKVQFKLDTTQKNLITRIYMRLELLTLNISGATYQRYCPELAYLIADGFNIVYNNNVLQRGLGVGRYHYWLDHFIRGDRLHLEQIKRNAGIGETIAEANGRALATDERYFEIPFWFTHSLCRALETTYINSDVLMFEVDFPTVGDVVQTDGTLPTTSATLDTDAGITSVTLHPECILFASKQLNEHQALVVGNPRTAMYPKLDSRFWDARESPTALALANGSTQYRFTDFASYIDGAPQCIILFFNETSDTNTARAMDLYNLGSPNLTAALTDNVTISLTVNSTELLKETPLHWLSRMRHMWNQDLTLGYGHRQFMPEHEQLPAGVIVIPTSTFAEQHPDLPAGGINFRGTDKSILTINFPSSLGTDLSMYVVTVSSNWMLLSQSSYNQVVNN